MLCCYVLVTKFIRIGIADKNDNPPYFDKALYEAEVDENEDIQHTVLTVTAKDHDECKYLHISALMRYTYLFPRTDVQGSFLKSARPSLVLFRNVRLSKVGKIVSPFSV